jgi:hypothetical protein
MARLQHGLLPAPVRSDPDPIKEVSGEDDASERVTTERLAADEGELY